MFCERYKKWRNQLVQNQPDCGKIKEMGDFLSTDPHKAEKNSERKKYGKADKGLYGVFHSSDMFCQHPVFQGTFWIWCFLHGLLITIYWINLSIQYKCFHPLVRQFQECVSNQTLTAVNCTLIQSKHTITPLMKLQLYKCETNKW